MGANCQIGAHAVVHGHVKMGAGNILHPHAVLGGLPQDTGFKAETDSWLIIGDNNNFRKALLRIGLLKRMVRRVLVRVAIL